jgi:hypothetical protein
MRSDFLMEMNLACLTTPSNELRHWGGVAGDPEHDGAIKYYFPAGIKVFGYEAREVLFFSESTTLFFMTLQSGLKHLPEINRILRLNPIKRGGSGWIWVFWKD